MFSRIDHAAWVVKDAEACVNFYCENLGFSVERRIEAGGPVSHIVFLRLGDTRLEILEKAAASPIEGAHISLMSTDFDLDFARLRDKGFRVLQEPVTSGPGRRRAAIEGPAGEEVEIIG